MKRCCPVYALLLCLLLAGCGKQMDATEEKADTTGTGTELVLPTGVSNPRKMAQTLPDPGAEKENVGTREHFSFVMDQNTYVFTEAETLWLYSQSLMAEYRTEFLLNVKGNKVVIAPLDTETGQIPSDCEEVYTDETTAIYQKEQEDADDELYLTVYGLAFQVTGWEELVDNHTVTLQKLYSALAQMGTAVTPASEDETLTDVITAMRTVPVFDSYKMAFREGVSYSGFFMCSPSSSEAVYEDVSIFMSVEIPDWNELAVVHVEAIPDYRERLEDTGKTFDGQPILADYAGELKYFILGTDGKCIYLEGLPGNAGSDTKSFTAEEAAYIFDVILTK